MIPHPRRCKRQARSLLLVGIAMANAARSELQRECNLRHSATPRPAPDRSIRTRGATCARPPSEVVRASFAPMTMTHAADRKSVVQGQRGSVRFITGGCSIIKKKTRHIKINKKQQ